MKDVRCLCCGSTITATALDVEFLCNNCDVDIYREIISNKYIYGTK